MDNKKKTALIVVDMLFDFADPLGAVFYSQNREILPNILNLLKIARERNLTIIFAQHYHRKYLYDKELTSGRRLNCIEGTGGENLLDELNYNAKTEYLIKKRRYNCFVGTDLDLILRENDIRRLIIVGTKTNCCIRSTVEGAYHLDYEPIVIRDCVATNDETTNNVHLNDISKYLGKVISLKEFADEAYWKRRIWINHLQSLQLGILALTE